MLKKIAFYFFMLWSLGISAQSSFKVMFYNLLEFPSANPSNRDEILRDILDVYQPDLFMVCELESGAGGNLILDASLNDTEFLYNSATFVPNQSSTSDLQQLLFFRKDKFILENEQIITTDVRDINHYTLKLRTENMATNPVVLELYVCHLKSSQGGSNQIERLQMVQKFTSDLENLDPNAFVLFAGDLNLYTSTEPAYVELLDNTNAITMVDPINTPGSWSSNINFQEVHTQSTRTSSSPFGAGAGGGLDDRFDFILMSENMQTNPTLQYISDTYKAFGNNGNCFNESINDPNCTGTFPQSLRDLLYNMSDHLPVIMDLETEETIVLSSPSEALTQHEVYLRKNIIGNQLEIVNTSNGNFRFEIYNLLGQRISNFEVASRENNTIDVSYLQTGVYFLRDNTNPEILLKFLKQ